MNNIKNILLALFICSFGIPYIAAQEPLKVTVKVVEPYKHSPIVGAIITATSFNGSVKTDEKGEAVLSVTSLKGELVVWFPGYYSNTQSISGRTIVNVTMIPDNKYGYNENIILPFRGSIKDQEKSTSLSSIQKKNISLSKISVDQAFSSIPGIQRIDKSGMPGEGSYFSIRGINTVIGNSSPLFVLNGVPQFPDMNESPVIGGYSKDIFNSINIQDVENITVLKGADAAIYGSLGSNGVILIETDKATDLDTKVQFIGQYGVDYNQSKMPVMGVNDYKRYIGEMALTAYSDMAEALKQFPYLIDDPNYYYKYLYNNNTDWQSLIYKPSFVTDNLLKIKGGDAIAKYDLSFGYLNKKSQLKGTGYTRYMARINSDVNLSKHFSLFGNFSMVYSENNLQEQGMLPFTNPVIAAMKKAPIFSPYIKDADNKESPDYAVIRADNGSLIVNNMVSNPLAIVNKVEAQSKVYDIQLNGGLNVTVNDYLKLYGIVGLYYNLNREQIFIPGMDIKAIMPLEDSLAKNTARAGVGESFNLYSSVSGTYTRTFNSLHAIRIMAGGQMAINSNQYDMGSGRNTSSDFYKTLTYVNSVGRQFWGYDDPWNWMNFYLNAQYVYNNQFGIGLNSSFDAASSSGLDAPRFLFFPAVNAAWYAKNSALLNQFDWLNKLTLRAEYSTTGNSRFSSMFSKDYYTVKPFRGISGLVRAGIPNTKLQSEITRTINLGIDLSMLDNRIDVTFDCYKSKSSNVILPSEISSAYGLNYYYDNVASIQNKGLDLAFQVALIMKHDFRWYIGATISKNINEVLDLGGSTSIINTFSDGSAVITEVGKPLYSFYGFKTNGIYATTSEALSDGFVNEHSYSFAAGDVHFVNQNSDKVINDKDRVNLGSAEPDFFGNINTTFQFKGFELSTTLSYSVGNKAYNALRRELESEKDFGNQLVSVNRRWAMEGQVTDIPRASYGDPMGNSHFSDRFIEDASYLKIKEVMLSYKFQFFKRTTTVYVSGENLYTFTKYLGQDPEFMYSYDSQLKGFDYAKVALARSFRIGFELSL
jgi:TonB-linked SusC/RagA family outer membrane protein